MGGCAAARGTVRTIRDRLASLAGFFGATTGPACGRRISAKGQRKDLHLNRWSRLISLTLVAWVQEW